MMSLSNSQRLIIRGVAVLLLGVCLLLLKPWLSDTKEQTAAGIATILPIKTAAAQTSTSDPKPEGLTLRDTLADGTPGPELVVIPAGVFVMGSPDTELGRYSNERHHPASIDREFAIGRFEVTFDDYRLFAEATGRTMPDDQNWGQGQRPVINVSWRDALAYTEWLSQQTGQTYRLPTETEWEYAARGGSQDAYWWGNEFRPDWVNCYDCNPDQEVSAPMPVGQFPANPFGIYDVLGNVWEWTCSNYSESFDGSETQCSAASDDTNKSIRGGSYHNRIEISARFSAQAEVFYSLRCAIRDQFFPDDYNDIVGFRVVRDL